MLNDIEVLNGTMTLAYNEYIYEYTVEVEEDIHSLDLNLSYDEDVMVNILNNDLKKQNNEVYIKVSKDGKEETYTLYVHKKRASSVIGIEQYKQSLIINTPKFALYKVQILSISIFLILVLIFSLMFKRKRH